MGRTMMGGLISATFLTLIVVPLFYTSLDDLRMVLQRVTSGAFSRWATDRGSPEPIPADD
jgi:hypothetical protein